MNIDYYTAGDLACLAAIATYGAGFLHGVWVSRRKPATLEVDRPVVCRVTEMHFVGPIGEMVERTHECRSTDEAERLLDSATERGALYPVLEIVK